VELDHWPVLTRLDTAIQKGALLLAVSEVAVPYGYLDLPWGLGLDEDCCQREFAPAWHLMARPMWEIVGCGLWVVGCGLWGQTAKTNTH
jgi:hypothetical protein